MYLTPENCVFCLANLCGKRGLVFPFMGIDLRRKIAYLGWKKKIDKWKGTNIYIVHKNRVIPEAARSIHEAILGQDFRLVMVLTETRPRRVRK
jgi:hypothetical protein